MRILYVSHAWVPESRGGTEIHARTVAKGLAERGHEMGVFARIGDPDRPAYEVGTAWDGPISVTRINNTFPEIPTFEWIYRNERVHEAFRRELDEFRPDLVHVHHLSGLSTTLLEEVKLRHLPLVLTLHDFWTICPRGQRMREDLVLCEDVDRETCFSCLKGLWPHLFADREKERTIVDSRGRLSPWNLAEFDRHMAYVLGLPDRVITPSRFHRERMLDLPLDGSRMVALPHGLDDQAFPEEAAEKPAGEIRRIGFIGSVIPVKGVHVLVEAFRELEGEDLELHVHGAAPAFHGDANYPERLRHLAGDDARIHFHGAYLPEEVPEILADLDLLVVPSLWWETFCLTIREGQLAGVPVIASDIGAMREALDGERDGLLFHTGDAQDLVRKIERVRKEPALRARLSGRRGAVKPLDRYLEELQELYLEAVSVAAERRGRLLVAPPAFPEPSTPPPAPRAEKVRVRPRKEVQVVTRPDPEHPQRLSVAVEVPEGTERAEIELEVDLAPRSRRKRRRGKGRGKGSAAVPSKEAAHRVSASTHPGASAGPDGEDAARESTGDRPKKKADSAAESSGRAVRRKTAVVPRPELAPRRVPVAGPKPPTRRVAPEKPPRIVRRELDELDPRPPRT